MLPCFGSFYGYGGGRKNDWEQSFDVQGGIYGLEISYNLDRCFLGTFLDDICLIFYMSGIRYRERDSKDK